MWKQRQGGKGDEEGGNDSWWNLYISGDILSDRISNGMDLNIREEDMNMDKDTMVEVQYYYFCHLHFLYLHPLVSLKQSLLLLTHLLN